MKKGSGTEEAVRKWVAGVFFDFSKVFYLVDHQILIQKLKYCGLDSGTVLLFENFLKDSNLYVEINGVKSNSLLVHFGVPK